jgi:hypothetical protein
MPLDTRLPPSPLAPRPSTFEHHESGARVGVGCNSCGSRRCGGNAIGVSTAGDPIGIRWTPSIESSISIIGMSPSVSIMQRISSNGTCRQVRAEWSMAEDDANFNEPTRVSLVDWEMTYSARKILYTLTIVSTVLQLHPHRRTSHHTRAHWPTPLHDQA